MSGRSTAHAASGNLRETWLGFEAIEVPPPPPDGGGKAYDQWHDEHWPDLTMLNSNGEPVKGGG